MRELRPYLVWAVAALFVPYQFALQVSVGVYADEIQNDLHATVSSIGVLTALFSVSYAMMQIPVGVLLDRLSPRILLTVSAAFCAGGALVFAGSEDLLMAGTGRLLMGVGAAFGFVGANFLAGRWLPPSRFALFVGLTEMMGVGGAAVFDEIAAWVEATMIWRDLIQYAAFFGFGLAALIWLVVRDYPEGIKPPSRAEGERLVDQAGALVTNGQIWLVGVFYFLSMGVLLGFAGLWNAPFQYSYGMTPSEVATANSLIFVGWAIGSPVAGAIASAFGHRKVVLLVSVTCHLAIMATIILTGLLPLWLIYLLRLGLGFFGGMNILAFALVSDAAPRALRGTALGIVNTFGFVGVTLLQAFPGFLLAGTETNTSGQYIHALIIYLLALLLAIGVVFFLKDKPADAPA